MFSQTSAFLREIWQALGGDPAACDRVDFAGAGALPAVYPVSDLAAATIGAASLALAELVAVRHGPIGRVAIDRRLASFWFAPALRPEGWVVPPMVDPIAGEYRAADGWIRLHTNAPHHRRVALDVLGVAEDRAGVARAVEGWSADALEAAVVAGGGAAAAMRPAAAWAVHPQGMAVAAEPLVRREATAAGPAAAWALPRDRPLAGIRVLDLTRVLAGPTSTRFLAGFGADVLRVDSPSWDEPGIVPEMTAGKRCTRLDLHRPGDRAAFEQLLAQADVLVHGYRRDALAGLGYGAEWRRARRPGLVEVSLTAYGWTGPWGGRRGFDSLVQMSAGIAEAGMVRLGRARPTPLPVQALDFGTGYLMAAAALRGLTERLTIGRGSEARLSLARTAALLASAATPAAGPFAAETPADSAAAVEQTAWGPARRLSPPMRLDGPGMRFDRAAGELGTAAASW